MRPNLQVDSFHVVCRFLAKFDGGLGLAALLWEAGEGGDGVNRMEFNSMLLERLCLQHGRAFEGWSSNTSNIRSWCNSFNVIG